MQQEWDLLLRGARVFSPEGLAVMDLAIRDGRIADLGPDLDPGRAAESEALQGLTLLPGVIDSQVHFREPGLTHKEDLASGTAAAALGGVTTILEMPNTQPATTGSKAIQDKLARAAGRAWVDHGFFIGGTAENIAELPRLERLPGVPGVKVFMGSSTGDLLVDDTAALEAILATGQRPVAIHAEDEARLNARRDQRVPGDASSHPLWRDPEAARLATERLLGLARAAQRPVHILHISTADELPLLAAARDIATCEVTPNHLSLVAPDCYRDLGTRAQMNPPLRDARHQAALWKAVRNGLIDIVGSDHAPHTQAEKAQDYPASPSGMPGVQTLLPLMLHHVQAGRLSLLRLIELSCWNPAKRYGLARKGRIALGYDADLVALEPDLAFTVGQDWLASKAGWSPYEGWSLVGMPRVTWLRGQAVQRDGALVGTPAGQPVQVVA